MKNAPRITLLLSGLLVGLLALPTWADEAGVLDKSAILDLLLKQTGVYDKSQTGKSPDFVVDPTWPSPGSGAGWVRCQRAKSRS